MKATIRAFINTNRVVIITLIGLMVFFYGISLYTGHVFTKDSYEYLNQAHNLRQTGQWYAGPTDKPYNPVYESWRPPLYGAIIAVSGALVRPIQGLLAVFNLVLVWFFCRDYLQKVPAWGGLLLLLFPAQLIYATLWMSEMVFQTFIMGGTLATLLYFRHLDGRYLVGACLCWTLAMLTKPVWALFFIPFLGYLIWLYVKRAIQLTWGWLAVLMPILTYFLLCQIHYQKTGRFEYSSISTTVLMQYHAYPTLKLAVGAQTAELHIDSLEVQAANLPYAQARNYLTNSALVIICQYPLDYLMLTLRGIGAFLLDPGRFDLHTFWYGEAGIGLQAANNFWDRLQQQSSWLILLGILLIVNTGSLVGLVYLLEQMPENERWFIVMVLGYLIVLTGANGAARFRVPVLPWYWLGGLVMLTRLSGWSNKVLNSEN